ncbi:hypothetical protein DL98DRAFT_533748 [Cadophora sp. DSE1049]|nr:hypothetical protein DL98DRAFT_533748 [Cadophora sp. DSE1049]
MQGCTPLMLLLFDDETSCRVGGREGPNELQDGEEGLPAPAPYLRYHSFDEMNLFWTSARAPHRRVIACIFLLPIPAHRCPAWALRDVELGLFWKVRLASGRVIEVWIEYQQAESLPGEDKHQVMLGNSGPSHVGLEFENMTGWDKSMVGQDPTDKNDQTESNGSMWRVPTSTPNMHGSAEKREVNKPLANVETTNHRLDPRDGTFDAGMKFGNLDTTQDKPPSDTPFTQSEKSFNDGDGEFSGETPASSPDEKPSVNGDWSQGTKSSTSSDTQAVVSWKTKTIPGATELTQDMSTLTLNKGSQGPNADSVGEASNETIEDSLSGDVRLKVQQRISRMNEVKTFFERFKETVQSGQRNELVSFELHSNYPLINQKDGIGDDVMSALSLEDLETVIEEISRSFDDLKVVVADISSSSVGTLKDPRPGYRSIKLTSMSFTPVGALKEKDHKKMMCHWVLSRQMGVLRQVSMKTSHMLQPMNLNDRLTTGSSYCHRTRGPFNIRGRWYSIRAYRILMEKYFDGLKKGLFSGPMLTYDPLPPNCDKWWLEQTFLQHYPPEHSRPHYELHSIDLPDDWQEIHDSSGCLCWVNHEFYFLTYKRPRTTRTAESVEEKRNRKVALIVSRSPRKAKSQCRPDQTSSSQLECENVMKSPQHSATQPEAAHGLGPGNDTIDTNDRSRVLLTTLPNITNMLGYLSEEDWFKEQDDSDNSPLLPNDVSRTPLPGLVAEILKELKEGLVVDALRGQTGGG